MIEKHDPGDKSPPYVVDESIPFERNRVVTTLPFAMMEPPIATTTKYNWALQITKPNLCMNI